MGVGRCCCRVSVLGQLAFREPFHISGAVLFDDGNAVGEERTGFNAAGHDDSGVDIVAAHLRDDFLGKSDLLDRNLFVSNDRVGVVDLARCIGLVRVGIVGNLDIHDSRQLLDIRLVRLGVEIGAIEADILCADSIFSAGPFFGNSHLQTSLLKELLSHEFVVSCLVLVPCRADMGSRLVQFFCSALNKNAIVAVIRPADLCSVFPFGLRVNQIEHMRSLVHIAPRPRKFPHIIPKRRSSGHEDVLHCKRVACCLLEAVELVQKLSDFIEAGDSEFFHLAKSSTTSIPK